MGDRGNMRGRVVDNGPTVPIAGEDPVAPSSQVRQWNSLRALSTLPDRIETFLLDRPFERMPWLAAAMLFGIAAWFAMPGPADWLTFIGVCTAVAGAALLIGTERWPVLRSAIVGVAVMLAAGCLLIWARSELVGTPPISGPRVTTVEARVLERVEQPARGRAQIVVATRDPLDERPIRVRLHVTPDRDDPVLQEGAVFRARIRMIPPQRAAVPGAYDFARSAWFEGLAATGSLLEAPSIEASGSRSDGGLGAVRRNLSSHVRGRVAEAGTRDRSATAIAATLVTGDRGAIEEDDAQAMRDAGLAHLLSISGLHVGAVIGIAWFAAMRLLALWPRLALRVRLPLVASVAAAMTGIAYTVLSGAALPTVRACIAALLVLVALALGRQALSMRLIALAAMVVMLFWPESVIGPSFQLSFAAVIAIVALHNTAPMRRMRDRAGRGLADRVRIAFLTLLFTGIAVELALMPFVLLHFHRAGTYGAIANLAAIPLTTIVVMPALGLGLMLDLVGLGGPAYWVAGHALQAVLAIARSASGSPGSVVLLGGDVGAGLLLFTTGGLWLAIWSGRIRLWGLVPMALGPLSFAASRPADLMVTGDGRHVVVNDGRDSYFLKTRPGFTRDTLLEMSGLADKEPRDITQFPDARCNADFCVLPVRTDGETRHILIARRRAEADFEQLVAACRESDVVVAQQMPEACRPRMLLADRALLSRRGGMAMRLDDGTTRFVRPAADEHGW